MHPILAHPGRLGTYLVTWLPVAGLLAIQIVVVAGASWLEAAVLSLPLALFYAFICLASWYPCRAMPPGKVSLVALASTQTVSALFSSAIWVAAGLLWVQILSRMQLFADLPATFVEIRALLAAAERYEHVSR